MYVCRCWGAAAAAAPRDDPTTPNGDDGKQDLNRDDAQELFDSFVGKWNRGKLSDMYYDGIPDHIQSECLKTQHRWGFLKKLDGKVSNNHVREVVHIGGKWIGRGVNYSSVVVVGELHLRRPPIHYYAMPCHVIL